MSYMVNFELNFVADIYTHRNIMLHYVILLCYIVEIVAFEQFSVRFDCHFNNSLDTFSNTPYV